MDVLDGLSSLGEKSLIRAQDDAHGDQRFLMLETIRAFAVERVEARPDGVALREAHATWFLGLAESVGAELGGSGRREALNRLEDDHDNLRTALAWFVGRGELAPAARLVVALWRFWQQHGHLYEARARADELLAADDRSHTLAPTERLALLSAAGGISYWQGEFPATHRRYREALEIARADGSPAGIAEALYNFSFAPVAVEGLSDWLTILATESLPILEEAMPIYRDLGDRAGQAKTLWAMSDYLLYGGSLDRAETSLLEALPLFRSLGDRFGEAWALHTLGLVHANMGDFRRASGDYAGALELFVEAGDVSGYTLAFLDLSGSAVALGEKERAIRLAGAADAIVTRTGQRLADPSSQTEALPPIPTRPESGPDLAVWEEGARMTAEDAIAYARETASMLRATGEA
jgi:tetratricopeptide (TPR) repeat protein